MSRQGLGLRGRLVGAVLVVLVGLLVITAAVVVVRTQAALLDLQRTRWQAATEQLADTVRYAVLARSAALLVPSLQTFSATPDLLRVEVLDDEGAVLAGVDGAGAHGGPADAVALEAEVLTRGQAPGDEGGELATFGAGQDPSRRVGAVRATFGTGSTLRLQRRLRNQIIAAFFTVGGLGLLVMLVLSSSVVRRVRRLANAVGRVARGDLEARVDDPGRDELGEVARDFNAMTEALRQQRAALDSAAERLAEREALAAIGRATAVIAHELKNPLGILLGAADIAANSDKPAAARTKAAQIIAAEVRRLGRTLDELLHYARPQPPRRQPVEVRALCEDVVGRCTMPGGPAEGVALRVEGPELTALCDREHVERIVLNLLSNAAQAGAANVALAVQATGTRVAISVRDDGPGLDATVREQLFRPFVTTKQRGAGLGLAGSRRLARDNGGELRWVESETGTCFVLELPLAESGEPAGGRADPPLRG